MSMPADRQPGKIVTFYSYKGGTGRTMALANIAWILASNGRRVLVVDWDLEAPGLHRYFHPFLVDPELAGSTGVMDMVWDYALATLDTQGDPSPGWHEPYADVLNHTVSLRGFEPGGVLSLLPAGRQDDAYGAKVNSFDWSSFYDKRGGGAFVEAMKQSMAAQFDYVLIDSRTGLSDTAGICTVQLPDILVTCFTFSTQSIAGTAAVVESVRRQRGERDITIWPVPMRVEDGETAKLEASRDLARIHLDHLLKGLDENARDRYWGAVEVPYKTLYAYEETLATVGDRPNQQGTILAASEQLTGYLTDQEIVRQVPLEESERRQLARQFQRQLRTTAEEFSADFLISYCSADSAWAEWLAWQLEAAGYRVIISTIDVVPGIDWITDLGPGTNWIEALERAMSSSHRILLAIVSRASIRSRSALFEWQISWLYDATQASPRIIPVRVEETALPGMLAQIVGIDLWGLDEAAAREVLLAAIGAADTGRSKPTAPPSFPPPTRKSSGPRPSGQGRYIPAPFPGGPREE
ncbi:KGGVGR-motif variant AAA ATPase [Frankia sp. CiP3]|uniref:KGGVGR-motif variant AAA ATPase n=1 Tax=Frankia sp. CiP3 TaxID=2880971 RepID=UPI001EF52FB7|nr:TIR domain-containing protein [Frankia sp. CiP3]